MFLICLIFNHTTGTEETIPLTLMLETHNVYSVRFDRTKDKTKQQQQQQQQRICFQVCSEMETNSSCLSDYCQHFAD